MSTADSTAQTSTNWQQDQRSRASTYKPATSSSQIPTTYGCAGDCSQPPPPAPGSDMEMFAAGAPTSGWWAVIASVALFYAGITLGRKARLL